MKKLTVLFLCIAMLLCLCSCSFLGGFLKRPDASLRGSVTYAEENGIKTAYYQDSRYVYSGSGDSLMKKTIFSNSNLTPLVLIGWTEHYLFYRTEAATSFDHPAFILSGSQNDIYYREDFDVTAERFVPDALEESSDEGIVLSSICGESANVGDISSVVLSGITLRSKEYPALALPLYLFEMDGAYYFYFEYGSYYKVSDAFMAYLIKSHVINPQNYV